MYAVWLHLITRNRISHTCGSSDQAKDMLNEMIEEVQSKYDMELQNCCNYDEMQSMLIEEARQDISMYMHIRTYFYEEGAKTWLQWPCLDILGRFPP